MVSSRTGGLCASLLLLPVLLAVLLAVLFLALAPAVSARAPQRIITIGGALTETVYALGGGALLAGADSTSDYPAEAGGLVKVGYQRALSAEGLVSLNPDLVILTDEAGPPAIVPQLASAGVKTLKLPAGRSLDDVAAMIAKIGAAIGRTKQAERLLARFAAEREKLAQKLAADKKEGKKAKRVLFILNHGGHMLMAGRDTAADSMIALAGGRNVVGAWRGYKALTPEAASVLAPDVLLITFLGLKAAGGEDTLWRQPALALTPAGKNRQLIAMDTQLLLGFGPRSAQAALQLHKGLQEG